MRRGILWHGARSGYRRARGRRTWVAQSRGRWEPVVTSGETAAPAVPRFRQAPRGLRVRVVAVRPVGSGRFNQVCLYCRHGLGPIRCTTFFQLFKLCSNFEIQNEDHIMSINVQTWHGASVGYSEQLLPLGPLPIPNRIPGIKFGTNSTLNLSLNF
jgi:hypothetical protein